MEGDVITATWNCEPVDIKANLEAVRKAALEQTRCFFDPPQTEYVSVAEFQRLLEAGEIDRYGFPAEPKYVNAGQIDQYGDVRLPASEPMPDVVIGGW